MCVYLLFCRFHILKISLLFWLPRRPAHVNQGVFTFTSPNKNCASVKHKNTFQFGKAVFAPRLLQGYCSVCCVKYWAKREALLKSWKVLLSRRVLRFNYSKCVSRVLKCCCWASLFWVNTPWCLYFMCAIRTEMRLRNQTGLHQGRECVCTLQNGAKASSRQVTYWPYFSPEGKCEHAARTKKSASCRALQFQKHSQ